MTQTVLQAFEAAQVPQHQIWLQGPSPTQNHMGALGLNYAPYQDAAPLTANAYTMILYVAGETHIRRTIDNYRENDDVGPGDISLHPACTTSRWSWQNPIDVLHIYFEPGYLRDLAHESLGKPCTLQMRHGLRLRDETLFELSVQLIQELKQSLLGAQRGAQAIGVRIALHLLRDYFHLEATPRTQSLSQAQMADLKVWIDAHLEDDLRVESLADRLELSVNHFSRIFGASFGISPHEYVRESRLRRAHDLLLTSEQSVSEIAFTTGFADQSHLTRWFKQRFGNSPGAFRRTRRESES